MLPLALAMSCSFVRCAIIASVVTRPCSAAAKSGADTRFSCWAVSDDAHPPVANINAATAVSMSVDLLTIAPQVSPPRRTSRGMWARQLAASEESSSRRYAWIVVPSGVV